MAAGDDTYYGSDGLASKKVNRNENVNINKEEAELDWQPVARFMGEENDGLDEDRCGTDATLSSNSKRKDSDIIDKMLENAKKRKMECSRETEVPKSQPHQSNSASKTAKSNIVKTKNQASPSDKMQPGAKKPTPKNQKMGPGKKGKKKLKQKIWEGYDVAEDELIGKEGGMEKAEENLKSSKRLKKGKKSRKNKLFPTLGAVKEAKLVPTQAVLPEWLRKPMMFDGKLDPTNKTYRTNNPRNGLSESIRKILEKNKIKQLLPVQHHVIPYILNLFGISNCMRPNDVCIASPTGSGKTLCYALPIIQWLERRVRTAIRALVVLPVTDLALQVYNVFKMYTASTNLKVGLSISESKGKLPDVQVDIMVATPGSLVDLIQRANGIDLTSLSVLVIDEADRMMQDIRHNWLQEIDRAVYGDLSASKLFCNCFVTSENLADIREASTRRYGYDFHCGCSIRNISISRPIQKLLFSATLTHDPEKLQQMNLFEPRLFVASSGGASHTITPKSLETMSNLDQPKAKLRLPSELEQSMIITSEENKPKVMWYLLDHLKYRRVLCFTESMQASHRLYLLLLQMPNLTVAEFSAKIKPQIRDALRRKFSAGKLDVIICSDILARGIDFENVNYVINYDPPAKVTGYIHRVGRTARAGKKGTALTLVTTRQLTSFKTLLKKAQRIKARKVDAETDKAQSPKDAPKEEERPQQDQKSSKGNKASIEGMVNNIKIEDAELESIEDAYKSAFEVFSNKMQSEMRKAKKRQMGPKAPSSDLNS